MTDPQPPIEVASIWQGKPPYPLRRVVVEEVDEHWVWSVGILGDNGEPVGRPRRSRSRRDGFLDRYRPAEADR